MKTIASCVEEIIITQPFIEEGLSKNIINYSALAEHLQPIIEKRLHKSIKTGAIMMALRRYNPPIHASNSLKMQRILKNLGDITVRSNLTDFTFQNSSTLIRSHAKILEQITTDRGIFYAFTRGILESNIIISSSEKNKIITSFTEETQLSIQENLSAISINLPHDNSKVPGLYYQIFKRLAWEGIALHEVISTTNEFTILVKDIMVDRAFSVIKNLKNEVPS
ncbi:MAG: aspartokinase [Dokdonia sp.]|jgi:aspartokinase